MSTSIHEPWLVTLSLQKQLSNGQNAASTVMLDDEYDTALIWFECPGLAICFLQTIVHYVDYDK